MRCLLTLGTLLLAIVGCQSATTTATQRTPTPAMEHQPPATRALVTCESLAMPARWLPWLSEPGSRLVVNPTVGNQAKYLTPATVPGLPMNLAYYVGEKPVVMPRFWSWSVERVLASYVPPIDLATDAPAWKTDDCTVTWADSVATVTVGKGPVAFIERSVTADLSQNPWLLVNVPELPEGVVWAAKVNDGQGGEDIFLQRDTRQAGGHAYDIAATTGWKGGRSFNVRLFAVGPSGNHVTFGSPKLVAGPPAAPLESTAVTWEPHRVVAQAAGGGMTVDSAIVFESADVVLQSLTVTRGRGTLIVTGEAPGTRVHLHPERRSVQIADSRLAATLETSRPTRLVGVWEHRRDRLAGKPPIDPPLVPATCWALAFDDLQPGDRVVVRAQFTPAAEVNFPPAAPTPAAFDALVSARAGEWAARLTKVPHLPTFDLTALDAKGATSEQVRQSYYKAWAFLFATILPPMPENEYPYPQVACGKPSTWDEGHPRAAASAQWESMIGMQLLALVDPETAWRAYEGMMSLVGADGTMGGEGLPSRHAQTAWVLYDRTHDPERLRKVYEPLKRMLLWKISDPRWIYKNQTPPGQKDAEFVTHALLDIGYAQRICTALGMTEEHAFWQQQSDQLAADFKQWFWEHSGDVPYRIYQADEQKRYNLGGSWTLQALALPPEILGQPERDSLLKLLRTLRKDDRPFLLPNLTKHATYLLTARGMLQYGTRDEAIEMLEAAVRDVIRAGEFAEWYEQGDEPMPAGVTPSIFGAAMVIDGWLLRNGIDVTGRDGQ